MKKRALFVIPALLILMNLVFFPSLLKADQVIKGNKHTDAFSMAGQSYPAKDEETTTWLGKDKMRRDEGETTTLIRLDENKMYVIDNTDKTYSEIDLPFEDLAKGLHQRRKAAHVTDNGLRHLWAYCHRQVKLLFGGARGEQIHGALQTLAQVKGRVLQFHFPGFQSGKVQ